MKTRPVFESFSQFVDFLNYSILEAELPKTDPGSIWAKSEEVYQKLGKDFDQMMAKWKLAYNKGGKLGGGELQTWADNMKAGDFAAIIISNPNVTAKLVQDGAKWSKFEGMSVTATPFSYENSIGPKVNSTFPLAKKGMINIYKTVNAMNTVNSASLFKGILSILQSGRPLEYDRFKDDEYINKKTGVGMTRGEKRDSVNEDAEKGYWWPSLRGTFKDDVLYDPVVLTGDKSSISPKKWDSKTGSITGLAPKALQDLTKQELTFKSVFYSVDSIELGTGVPRTEIEEKTVEVPIVEESSSNVTKIEEVPTPSGLFAARQSTPVKGKEGVVIAAINTIFSQFTSIESVEVQGSTSWEWEGKRNDPENDKLGKARAEYFVKVINEGAGKEIAKIGDTEGFPSNVIQPKDKENEDVKSWRKVNLKIKGTKAETKETSKIIFKVEDEEVVLRRDKINMTEYVVNWTIKSGSKVVKKEGWKN